jgi:ribosomal protein L7/L12
MARCNSCGHENPPHVRHCEACGTDLPRTVRSVALTTSLEQEVHRLLDQGRKIEAIKRVRELTGAGLKAAKDAVEAVEQGLTSVDAFALEEPSLRELVELVRSGNKIEAIKLYRERTGVGLKEAKDAVEALERADAARVTESVGESFRRQLVALLGAGRKIEAIKLYRERTGVGLKQAKDAVERLGAEHGLPDRRAMGCLGMMVLLFLVSVGATLLG